MPKIVDHERRKSEIADSVLQLISSTDTQSVTTREVSRISGWSAGAVSHYFPTRSELMLGALNRAADLQQAEVRKVLRLPDLRPIERLQLLTESVLPLDTRRLAMTRIFVEFYAIAKSKPMTHELIANYLEEWRKAIRIVLRQCIDAGELRTEMPVEDLAAYLIAFTDGFAIHGLIDSELPPRVIDALRITGSTVWFPVPDVSISIAASA